MRHVLRWAEDGTGVARAEQAPLTLSEFDLRPGVRASGRAVQGEVGHSPQAWAISLAPSIASM